VSPNRQDTLVNFNELQAVQEAKVVVVQAELAQLVEFDGEFPTAGHTLDGLQMGAIESFQSFS
jgi:hypothetical protein